LKFSPRYFVRKKSYASEAMTLMQNPCRSAGIVPI
jgi:hypothetical protein